MRRAAAAVLCALLLTLTGCGPRTEELTTTVFCMDTVMELSLWHDGSAEEAFRQEVDGLYALERLLSPTLEGSDIHSINTAGGKPVEVDAVTAQVLEQGLALCEKTGGTLDITLYPAVKAWGFTTGTYRVPDAEERAALAGRADYSRVEVAAAAVTLPEGMELDLGAVAKGYAADRMVERLEALPCGGLLNLGQSTIAAIGGKPDGSPWRIGIQDPAGSDYLGVLELKGQAMGSSGNYQRFFEENGVIYGHIIDPDTAAPADSGLAGVTVVADSALYCDGLSTALFVMGPEQAADFWRENRDFDAILIEESGAITLTPGLKDSFSLRPGYTDREVSVLE